MRPLTKADKMLDYLSRLSRYSHEPDDSTFPRDLTQPGIADSLVMDRGHVASELGILEEKGLVRSKTVRVAGASRRLKVFLITRQGELRAAEVASRQACMPSDRGRDAASAHKVRHESLWEASLWTSFVSRIPLDLDEEAPLQPPYAAKAGPRDRGPNLA